MTNVEKQEVLFREKRGEGSI